MTLVSPAWSSHDDAADAEASRREAKEREAKSAAKHFSAHFSRQRADGRTQQVWVQGGVERRCTAPAHLQSALPSVFELAGQCGPRAVRRRFDGPGERNADLPWHAEAEPEDEAAAASGQQQAEERMLDDVREWLEALGDLPSRGRPGLPGSPQGSGWVRAASGGPQDARRLFPQLDVQVRRDATGACVELRSHDAAEGHWLEPRLQALQVWLSRRWGTPVRCRVQWDDR